MVTEGILTRQLQRDPALDGVGLVIFDEFHERSLQADTGLAFVLDAQRHLAPDLRILVMSATLDGAALARLLDGAPVISAPGLSYPVETRYAERATTEYLDRQAAAAIRRALRDDEGDILVFLPGAGEIRRVERALADARSSAGPSTSGPSTAISSREAQDLAIQPGTRRASARWCWPRTSPRPASPSRASAWSSTAAWSAARASTPGAA